MSQSSKLLLKLVAFALVGGLMTVGAFMFWKNSTPSKPAAELPTATELEPLQIPLDAKNATWLYIDYERGLQPVSTPEKVPDSARGAVVVWTPEIPDTRAYFVTNLWSTSDGQATAKAMPEQDFERVAQNLSTAQFLGEDAADFSEELTISIAESKIHKRRKRKNSQVKIRRLNRYPSFAIPGGR